MLGLFQPASTVKDTIFPYTCGYDFHYVIAEGEAEKAATLRLATVEFIRTQLKNESEPVFLTQQGQTHGPIGPWRQAMWEIQLCTVDSEVCSPSDPYAIDKNRQAIIQKFMLKVAAFLEKEIKARQMQGSLLIHANTWPINSNQELERELHFSNAWVVCGKVDLKDIWSEKDGLIDMEAFVKEQMAARNISDLFHTRFPNKNVSQLWKLFHAQLHLAKMNQDIENMLVALL